MTDDDLASELAELTVALGGDPHPDVVALGLRVLRADLCANKQYRLDAPFVLPCNLRTIGWHDDREIRPEQMNGWQAYAEAGRHKHIDLPGTHHEFLSAPGPLLQEIADGLRTTERRH